MDFFYLFARELYSIIGEKNAKKMYRNKLFQQIIQKILQIKYSTREKTISIKIKNLIVKIPRDRIEFYYMGDYEEKTLEVFLSNINEGDCIIDAGAHIRYFSIHASKKVGPEGIIYAFEPCPETYSILVENLIENKCDNVLTIPYALSNVTGIIKLQLNLTFR